MNKILNLIIILVLCLNLVNANLVLTESQPTYQDNIQAEDLDEAIEEYNRQSGENPVQPNIEEQIHEYRVDNLLTQADNMWDLIITLFKLIVDTVVLLLLLFEMYLLLKVITELLPSIFKKITTSVAKFFVKRY